MIKKALLAIGRVLHAVIAVVLWGGFAALMGVLLVVFGMGAAYQIQEFIDERKSEIPLQERTADLRRYKRQSTTSRDRWLAWADGLTEEQWCAYYEGPKRLMLTAAQSLLWDYQRDRCAGVEWMKREVELLKDALFEEGIGDLRGNRQWGAIDHWLADMEELDIEAERKRLGITEEEYPTAAACSFPGVMCIDERDRLAAAAYADAMYKQQEAAEGGTTVLGLVLEFATDLLMTFELASCIEEQGPRAFPIYECVLSEMDPEAAKSLRE